MVDPGCWDVLGIAATEDMRAIRTAYAARLKEIDPETDPMAFVALRAALTAAMGGSAAPVAPEYPAPAPARPYPIERGAAPKPDNAAEQHAKAILGLLYDHSGDPWLSEADQAALIAHWRALAADPQMEQIGHYAMIERWASVVIAETSPLSAPILMLAAERFGWKEADTKANADPHIAEIARRYRLLHLIHVAYTKGTSWHPAWVELTTPADPFSSFGRVDVRKLFDLLAAVRYALPQIEGQFDPIRVMSWEAEALASTTHAPLPQESRWVGCVAFSAVIALLIVIVSVMNMISDAGRAP